MLRTSSAENNLERHRYEKGKQRMAHRLLELEQRGATMGYSFRELGQGAYDGIVIERNIMLLQADNLQIL